MIHQVVHAIPNQNEDFSGDNCLKGIVQAKIAFLKISNVTKNGERGRKIVHVETIAKTHVMGIADQVIKLVHVKRTIDYFRYESQFVFSSYDLFDRTERNVVVTFECPELLVNYFPS